MKHVKCLLLVLFFVSLFIFLEVQISGAQERFSTFVGKVIGIRTKTLVGCGKSDRQGDHEFQNRTENGLHPPPLSESRGDGKSGISNPEGGSRGLYRYPCRRDKGKF